MHTKIQDIFRTAKSCRLHDGCLCCQNEEGTIFLDDCRDYFMGFPGKFSYVRCARCGLVQINPVPENIMQYYKKYFVHDHKSVFHKYFRRLLLSAGYSIPKADGPALKILDYGCGDGWYLQYIKTLGYDACGFEPADGQAELLSQLTGLKIFGRREELLSQKEGFFDIVTMHFVLEHATDLRLFFEDSRRLLRPGGRLHVLIPSLESLGFKIFGRYWHGLDAPRHVSFPQQAVLEKLGGDHDLIFVEQRSVPMPNVFAGSLCTVVAGKFNYPLFCLFIPFAVFFSQLFPGESIVAEFVRK